jgi:hypothetical protein
MLLSLSVALDPFLHLSSSLSPPLLSTYVLASHPFPPTARCSLCLAGRRGGRGRGGRWAAHFPNSGPATEGNRYLRLCVVRHRYSVVVRRLERRDMKVESTFLVTAAWGCVNWVCVQCMYTVYCTDRRSTSSVLMKCCKKNSCPIEGFPWYFSVCLVSLFSYTLVFFVQVICGLIFYLRCFLKSSTMQRSSRSLAKKKIIATVKILPSHGSWSLLDYMHLVYYEFIISLCKSWRGFLLFG